MHSHSHRATMEFLSGPGARHAGWPFLLLLLALPACSGDPVTSRAALVCLPLGNGFSGKVDVEFQSGYEARGGVTYEIVRGQVNDLAATATAPGGSSAELRMTMTALDSIRLIASDPALMGQQVLLRVRAVGRLEQTTGFANWSRVEARVGLPGDERLWIIASSQMNLPLLEIDEVQYLFSGARLGEWTSLYTQVTHWAASGAASVTVANSSAFRVEILDAVVWDNANQTVGQTAALRQICSASGTQYLGG